MKVYFKSITCILALCILIAPSIGIVYGDAELQEKVEIEHIQKVLEDISPEVSKNNNYISRANFTALVVRILKLKANSDANFSDVYFGARYAKELGIAKKLEIIYGTGNNKFKPEDSINRQDMIVVLYNALRLTGVNIKNSTDSLSNITDKDKISKYAYNAVGSLLYNNIINSDTYKIEPIRYGTKTEAIDLIYRAVNIK